MSFSLHGQETRCGRPAVPWSDRGMSPHFHSPVSGQRCNTLYFMGAGNSTPNYPFTVGSNFERDQTTEAL